jgi:DNA-binding NarL/FixJ family response regulator
MTDRVRIVLVDDHPLWRRGIAAILSRHAAFEVVGQGSSESEAVQLAGDLLPDVILLDVSMGAGSGVRAAGTIAKNWPDIKIIMLTVSDDEEAVSASLQCGVRAYVLKGVSGSRLITIVEAVQAGATYVSPVLKTLPPVKPQTVR